MSAFEALDQAGHYGDPDRAHWGAEIVTSLFHLELALRRVCGKLASKRCPQRSDEDRYVFGRRPAFIASDMASTRVYVSLAFGDYLSTRFHKYGYVLLVVMPA